MKILHHFGLAYFNSGKPENVIFGPIKVRFTQINTVQKNLNRSGPADFWFSGPLVGCQLPDAVVSQATEICPCIPLPQTAVVDPQGAHLNPTLKQNVSFS